MRTIIKLIVNLFIIAICAEFINIAAGRNETPWELIPWIGIFGIIIAICVSAIIPDLKRFWKEVCIAVAVVLIGAAVAHEANAGIDGGRDRGSFDSFGFPSGGNPIGVVAGTISAGNHWFYNSVQSNPWGWLGNLYSFGNGPDSTASATAGAIINEFGNSPGGFDQVFSEPGASSGGFVGTGGTYRGTVVLGE